MITRPNNIEVYSIESESNNGWYDFFSPLFEISSKVNAIVRSSWATVGSLCERAQEAYDNSKSIVANVQRFGRIFFLAARNVAKETLFRSSPMILSFGFNHLIKQEVVNQSVAKIMCGSTIIFGSYLMLKYTIHWDHDRFSNRKEDKKNPIISTVMKPSKKFVQSGWIMLSIFIGLFGIYNISEGVLECLIYGPEVVDKKNDLFQVTKILTRHIKKHDSFPEYTIDKINSCPATKTLLDNINIYEDKNITFRFAEIAGNSNYNALFHNKVIYINPNKDESEIFKHTFWELTKQGFDIQLRAVNSAAKFGYLPKEEYCNEISLWQQQIKWLNCKAVTECFTLQKMNPTDSLFDLNDCRVPVDMKLLNRFVVTRDVNERDSGILKWIEYFHKVTWPKLRENSINGVEGNRWNKYYKKPFCTKNPHDCNC